jgi:hypothetical protein
VDLTYDHHLWPFFVVVLDVVAQQYGYDVVYVLHHVAHVGVFYAVFVYSALLVASPDYIKLVIDVT